MARHAARLADADAPPAAALAVDEFAAVVRPHAGPEAALAFALDLADPVRVIHKRLTIEKSRPKTASHIHTIAIPAGQYRGATSARQVVFDAGHPILALIPARG
jgi:hypothetical protein